MPNYTGVPITLLDASGNPIYPVVPGLANLPMAIQVHDPSGGPYIMCTYLNGGAPIQSSDYALLFPGSFTNGSPNDLWTQITAIHRMPAWNNWLTADNFVAGTNGVTSTAYSAEPASTPSPSTQPYTTLTGGFTAGDIAAWNPEPAHTAAAEITAMATTMSAALADGLANSPALDVWWVPLSSLYTTDMSAVGPLVKNCIYQAQNVSSALFVSTVTTALALARAQSPAPKVWVQGSATPTSNFYANLIALAGTGVYPDGIVILTEPATVGSYLTDLQTIVTQIRG